MASRVTGTAISAATTLLALLAGCAGPVPGGPNVYASPTVPICTKQTSDTLSPGHLTVGTGPRPAAPWFVGPPAGGRGFESAVTYAVAERLGFDAADVRWITVTDSDALAAGAKPFDVAIGLFAHSPARKKLVDMSSWYYLDRQAVVVPAGSAFAGAGSIAGLRVARLGARTGSTGQLAIAELIAPVETPLSYDRADDASQALWRRQIDALVVDLPAAFAMVAARPDDLVLAGYLPRVGVPDQFGLVMEKGSSLRPCVKKAVEDLRVDGTLLELELRWLMTETKIPELS
jgi:polar amino acid transport system substrate-binding protein